MGDLYIIENFKGGVYMLQSLLFQVQFKLSALSDAEQAVAKYVLANAEEVIHLSTQQLAKRAGVSNATITRFCKSVGTKGFPDFKIIMSSEIASPHSIQEELKPDDSLNQIKHQLSLRMTSAIKETESLVQNNSIESCTKLLKNADEIVVYGIGASHIIAKDLAQKFIRIGKSVLDTQDTHLVLSSLASNPRKKAMILISNSGEKLEINTIAKVCNEFSIPIISIVSDAESTLATKSTVILLHSKIEMVDTLRSASTASLIAQHYLVDLLYYHYLADNYHDHVEKLKTTYAVVRENLH